MSNHYHLLLELDDPCLLSGFMAGFNRAYTHYYHKVNKSSGLLWQGRFKSQPVQKENYMLVCGRYIERNPVVANIVSEAVDYTYSSAKFYCSGIFDIEFIKKFVRQGRQLVPRRAGRVRK